jgi:hypothetical protein
MNPIWPLVILASMCAATACASDADEEPRRPAITRPLDAHAFADRPCDLLPMDQAARLGYPRPGKDYKAAPQGDSGQVASCDRTPPGTPSLTIRLYLSHDELDYRYRQSKGSKIADTQEPWIAPLTVLDQPAVTVGRSQRRPNAECKVVVGLTDTQSVEVWAPQRYENPQGYDDGLGDGRACEYAIPVAEAIVRNLVG